MTNKRLNVCYFSFTRSRSQLFNYILPWKKSISITRPFLSFLILLENWISESIYAIPLALSQPLNLFSDRMNIGRNCNRHSLSLPIQLVHKCRLTIISVFKIWNINLFYIKLSHHLWAPLTCLSCCPVWK